MSTANNKLTDDIKTLVGYGEKLKVFIGVGEDKADELGIREFHFTPVAIKDLPVLSKAVHDFQVAISGSDSAGKKENAGIMKEFTEETVNDMTVIVQMSLSRSEPDVTSEQIRSWFSFSALLKIAKLALSVNEMEGANEVDPTMLAATAKTVLAKGIN